MILLLVVVVGIGWILNFKFLKEGGCMTKFWSKLELSWESTIVS